MGAVYTPSEITDPPSGANQIDEGWSLRRLLLALMYPNWLDRTLNRLRATVVLESGTVTTVTTVTTISNCSTIDNIQGRLLMNASQLDAWQHAVRGRFT